MNPKKLWQILVLSTTVFGIYFIIPKSNNTLLNRHKFNQLGVINRTNINQIKREEPALKGIASWYGPGFHQKTTANGETFDTNELTAAHLSLPFGTFVRVTNTDNGRSIVVRINDRGPYVPNRIIDVSKAAAQHLEMKTDGIALVELEVLGVN